eukprot:407335_1
MSCCLSWIGCGCDDPSGPKTAITNYKHRNCTDVPFLALFMAILSVIALSCWSPAFADGQYKWNVPAKILFPHDFAHNPCGYGAFADKPVAYWPFIKAHGNDTIRRHKTLKLCAK